MLVSAREAYRLWAPEYDRNPNPLLALETRILRDKLGPLRGKTVLDSGSGTGRWMKYALAQGARAYGVDLSVEMLSFAPGSRVQGDLRHLPFADDTVDLAICSMTLGYLKTASEGLNELARVARRVIVSDFHPDATSAGWTRSFRIAGQAYAIEHYCHSCIEFEDTRMSAEWRMDACIGEPERPLFEAAGRSDAFEAACRVPAIYAECWSRVAD